MADIRVLCEVCEKGKFVVNRCLKNGNEINTEKLEKLLILMQGEMLKKYNKPFFEQQIIVKDKNIVIPKLNREFYMYNEGFNERFCEYYHLTRAEQEIMDIVIEKYSNFDVEQLKSKRELIILGNMFVDSTNEFDLIFDEMIKSVFVRCNYFENYTPKENTNIKTKKLALK